MIRKMNRAVKNWLRPKRIAFGRIIWDRKKKKSTDLSEIRSILFMRYDGKIGDMVVNTLMFREIKKVYPDIKIGVVTRGAAIDIIKDNPYVDDIYIFEKDRIKKLAAEIAKRSYDLLLDFSETLRVNEMMFINLCHAKINMGLDKKSWRLFDISIDPVKDFEWNDHITKRYFAYLKKLGITSPDLSYELFIPKKVEESARIFCENISEDKKIVLNPYGASKHKNFNEETLNFITDYLLKKKYAVIFIAPPDKRQEIEKFIKEKNSTSIYFNSASRTILDSAAVIEKADLIITPDTSIVHIATAMDKKIISVYPPNGGTRSVDHLVWSPLGKDTVMLFCEEIKNRADVMDINRFNKEEMKNYIDSYLN